MHAPGRCRDCRIRRSASRRSWRRPPSRGDRCIGRIFHRRRAQHSGAGHCSVISGTAARRMERCVCCCYRDRLIRCRRSGAVWTVPAPADSRTGDSSARWRQWCVHLWSCVFAGNRDNGGWAAPAVADSQCGDRTACLRRSIVARVWNRTRNAVPAVRHLRRGGRKVVVARGELASQR